MEYKDQSVWYDFYGSYSFQIVEYIVYHLQCMGTSENLALVLVLYPSLFATFHTELPELIDHSTLANP